MADKLLHERMKWKVTQVLDNAGANTTGTDDAVVVSGSFNSSGGKLLIIGSGSFYGTVAELKTIRLQIDDVTVATKQFFMNEIGEHHAFATTVTVETEIGRASCRERV